MSDNFEADGDFQRVIGVKGKIKLVMVKDFITFDYARMYPGEYLNVIIGPNGTGKSTMVAAILIGLGGNCRLLSRSSDIQDFIKNGKTKAEISIEIYSNDDGDSVILQRTFDTSKSYKFFINGRTVPMKDYLKEIAKFNIQIDNMCQFLPQDRVQDFAKMNPEDILLNTQKSVCSAETIAQFERLKEFKEKVDSSGSELAACIKKLQELETRNEALKVQIDNMNLRNNLIKSVEICEMRKSWLEYHKLVDDCKTFERDLVEAQKILSERLKELEPIAKQQKHFLKKKQEFEVLIRTESNLINNFTSEFNKFETAFEKFEDLINTSKSTLESALQTARDYENELSNSEGVLQAFRNDLQRADKDLGPEVDQKIKDSKIKYDKLKAVQQNLITKRDAINTKLDREFQPEVVNLKRKIEQMENIPELRLKTISRQYPDTFKGIMWLREHRDQFQSNIYETALLECNLKHAKYAKYVENVISLRDLTAFICESTEDSIQLMDVFRKQMNLKLTNIACNAHREIYPPDVPLSEIKAFGFQLYLVDVIDGPPPIINQFCRLFNIHNIPIGNDYTYANADKIPSNIRLFFTPNHRFHVSVSKYTGNKSTAITEISGRNLMDNTIDQEELDSCKQRLANIYRDTDSLKNKRNELDTKCLELSSILENEKKVYMEFEKKKGYAAQLHQKIQLQERKIRDMKSRNVDVDEQKRIYKQTKANILKKMSNNRSDFLTIFERLTLSRIKRDKEVMKNNLFKKSSVEIEAALRSIQNRINEAKKIVEHIEFELKRKREMYEKQEREARKLTNGLKPTDRKFPYRNEFNELPSDMVELINHMDDIQSRIDCLLDNTIDTADYENRLRQIEALKTRLADQDTFKAHMEIEMRNIHAAWYPKMLNIVKIINKNFSYFMNLMSYAGEVELINKGEEDYKSYGICIWVKYRSQEKMQKLDRHIQSGGERAVAIAIYMLSLQHISHVPFRCVDEINQGMDRRNEKKIFDLLVKETNTAGRSQYFFVTPKPIKNLASNDLMKVIVVHNGMGMLQEVNLEHIT